MSIAGFALSEGSLADQPADSTVKQKPPPRRQTVAKTDAAVQPEAR